MGCSPWSHQELDTIEQLTFSFHARCFTYIISSFFFFIDKSCEVFGVNLIFKMEIFEAYKGFR